MYIFFLQSSGTIYFLVTYSIKFSYVSWILQISLFFGMFSCIVPLLLYFRMYILIYIAGEAFFPPHRRNHFFVTEGSCGALSANGVNAVVWGEDSIEVICTHIAHCLFWVSDIIIVTLNLEVEVQLKHYSVFSSTLDYHRSTIRLGSYFDVE